MVMHDRKMCLNAFETKHVPNVYVDLNVCKMNANIAKLVK